MAHRHKKGETGEASVDVGRRVALARLGLGFSAAYAAPVLLTLSSAQAGVVIGDGDLDNNNPGGGGGGSGSSGSSGSSGGSGASAGSGPSGSGKGSKGGKKRGRGRMSLRELLDYLGNLAKRNGKR
jgi:hypothetical protein